MILVLNVKSAMAQLAGYRSKTQGIWVKEFLWRAVGEMSPIEWWTGMATNTDISLVAKRILSAPTTSAATERSFSRFGFVHSKKRSRLTCERAGKITYIGYNYFLTEAAKHTSAESSSEGEDDEV